MFERSAARGERLVWSVAGLVNAVSDALAARFSACVVQGELSGFSRAASGHCYFSLKDADGQQATIRCAMFRRAASLVGFSPADGQRVEVRGRLAVYEPRGELQFVVESMQQAGAGALYEQFLRLKARLEAEGLFDPARKRELPRYPRRLGVVTSTAGAALHDVLSALERRAPHVAVVVYPSLVQGAEAPAALVRALALAAERDEVDALIVCRGGGSLEDLWAFNDERVVRAIAASPLPTICGVGHETDVTLADFVADLRAPTPTAAAELAAPPVRELAEMLAAFATLMQRRMHHVLDQQSQWIDRAALRLARPGQGVRATAQRLQGLAHRLQAGAQRRLQADAHRLDTVAPRLARSLQRSTEGAGHRVNALAARLQAVDPRQVLARGYAWLEDEQGAPVASVAALAIGQRLGAVLSDGRATVDVTQVTSSDARLQPSSALPTMRPT